MINLDTAFDDAYSLVETEVNFNPLWSYPTGAMHRAAWSKFEQVSKFTDDRGRRAIAIPLSKSLDGQHKTLIVYEQKNFQKGLYGSDGLHNVAFQETLDPLALVLVLDLVKSGRLGVCGLSAMCEIAKKRAPNHRYFLDQMLNQFKELEWAPQSAQGVTQ